MTALFNAGRQAAALEMFAQTKRVLADELGLDPSRELRAVMEQILRQDPAITPTPAGPAREPAAGNLPSRTTSFVGRVEEGGTATRRPSDLLVRHLGARDVLVVLDNCEHLIEPIATLVEAVLGRCPDLRIMTTSRETLAVPREVQLVVGPLAVPHPDTPPARVPSFPAARLFLDRAHEMTPDLVLDDDELTAVGVISRRLDGIPLALELAAARLASLTPRELADRVVDRFAVLTSGSRTADARQQTLRNTVDWSHELLTGPERVLFRRLAVFRGGWTLAAAEDVVTDSDLPEGAVLDLSERLVRQSLVVADKTAGHTRYRMLETLREYAADKLRQAGEDNPLADAHAAYFLRMGEEAESGLRGPSQSGWLQRLDRSTRTCARRYAGSKDRAGTSTGRCGWPDPWACTGTWVAIWRAVRRSAWERRDRPADCERHRPGHRAAPDGSQPPLPHLQRRLRRATTNTEIIAAIKTVVPDADLRLPSGGSRPETHLDITRIHDDTGYQPEYDTERAAADYIAWLRSGNER